MYDHGIGGTGTASDAVCLLCPIGGVEEPFGGPRSVWGRRLADATYHAVAAGIVDDRPLGEYEPVRTSNPRPVFSKRGRSLRYRRMSWRTAKWPQTSHVISG